jgi:hypothetical protein
MAKMKSGNESKAYRTFRQASERALEELHRNAILEINDLARNAFVNLVAQAIFTLKQLPQPVTINHTSQSALTQCNAQMDSLIQPAARDIADAIKRLKRRAYILAYVSAAEGAGRLTGKPTKFSVIPGEVDQLSSTNFEGVPIINRITLALSRVKRDLLDALEFSIVQELPEDEAIQKMLSALPKTRKVIRPKKAIQKLTEAEFVSDSIGTDEFPVAMSSGFVTDDEWEDIVSAYKQAYVPKYRGPKDIISDRKKPDGSDLYVWEVEKETTHEFVTDVRKAAERGESENGITDFVWVAVVDQDTDECCLWRDGLLVSEIEKELKSHKNEDEDCGEGITPPIHFNCRCTLAPAVEEIPDLPDNNLAEFEDWLNV